MNKQNSMTNLEYATLLVNKMNCPEKRRERAIQDVVRMLASRALLEQIERDEMIIVSSGNSFLYKMK